MLAHAAAAAQLIERLIANHRDIEEGTDAVRAACARGDGVLALVALGELHLAMARHDGLEDNALFPLVGARWPAVAERLVYVRDQHRAMHRLRRAVERALVADDAVAALRQAEELGALAVGNHATEELVVFGVLEQLLAQSSPPRAVRAPVAGRSRP